MRITGGALRSRRLVAPPGTATRPTSDRVREALFSILGGPAAFAGARVLDLYAGSGALAFEALSRGADHATLVDRAREAATAIRTNAAALGVGARITLVAAPVDRALRTLASGPRFDFVFVDPPYADVASGDVARVLTPSPDPSPIPVQPGIAALMSDDARLVLEHASKDQAPALAGLSVVDTRRYGDTALAVFMRQNTSDAR